MAAIKMRATHRKSANEKTRMRGASVKACDAAMTRKGTRVRVPSNPFQNVRAIFTELPSIDECLKATLGGLVKAHRENPGKIAPHSVTIHEDHCAFGIIIWPRASDGADLDDMRDAVEERDHNCGCKPIVLYPGALA